MLAMTASTMFGASAKHGDQHRAGERDAREEVEDQRGVAEEQPGSEPRADRQAEELERLGDRGQVAALQLVEVVDLLVEQAAERDEPDDRHGQERHGVPDASQDLDLPQQPPRLGEARARLLGVASPPGRARRPALLRAPHGSAIRAPRITRSTVGTAKTKNGARQPKAYGQRAGEQRAEELAEHVRGAVEREDRRVGGRPSRSPTAASCGSGRRPPARCPSRRRAITSIQIAVAAPVMIEKTAHSSAPSEGDGDRLPRSATTAIGICISSAPSVVRATRVRMPVLRHAERVADVRQQDAEAGPVELVHGVQAEQDQQREHRSVADDLLERAARVAAVPPHGADRRHPWATRAGRPR